MSGHLHLFVDETGGAHSPDFAGATETASVISEKSVADRWFIRFRRHSEIARASEKELRECTLGYRAKNLRATAQLVSSGNVDLEAWSSAFRCRASKTLCALPGVGPKIANCVMLFAYERLRAFPIDVWIERVLRQHYFPRRRKMTAQRLREFSETYFGEHGGYAQQYLFHHARTVDAAIGRLRSIAPTSGRNELEVGGGSLMNRRGAGSSASCQRRRPEIMFQP